MSVMGIDPGEKESGYVIMNKMDIVSFGHEDNNAMLDIIIDRVDCTLIAIEMIDSYGMPVGREVFETCVWIGRFIERCSPGKQFVLITRRNIKLTLCNSSRAKDSNIRQAILDLYPRTGGGATPQIGTKKFPGPLYGVSNHVWPAIGVCLCAQGLVK